MNNFHPQYPVKVQTKVFMTILVSILRGKSKIFLTRKIIFFYQKVYINANLQKSLQTTSSIILKFFDYIFVVVLICAVGYFTDKLQNIQAVVDIKS